MAARTVIIVAFEMFPIKTDEDAIIVGLYSAMGNSLGERSIFKQGLAEFCGDIGVKRVKTFVFGCEL